MSVGRFRAGARTKKTCLVHMEPPPPPPPHRSLSRHPLEVPFCKWNPPLLAIPHRVLPPRKALLGYHRSGTGGALKPCGEALHAHPQNRSRHANQYRHAVPQDGRAAAGASRPLPDVGLSFVADYPGTCVCCCVGGSGHTQHHTKR